jgi:hypothetical protein
MFTSSSSHYALPQTSLSIVEVNVTPRGMPLLLNSEPLIVQPCISKQKEQNIQWYSLVVVLYWCETKENAENTWIKRDKLTEGWGKLVNRAVFNSSDFGVLIVVTVFWDVMLCTLVSRYLSSKEF